MDWYYTVIQQVIHLKEARLLLDSLPNDKNIVRNYKERLASFKWAVKHLS